MGCLGVHFALDDAQVAALKAVDEDERVDYVEEEIAEPFLSSNQARAQETDKAWDAIHRALTDGTLDWETQEYPLNHVIYGGESLYEGDDFLMSLKTPQQVRDLAAALSGFSMEQLRAGYDRIDADDHGLPLTDDDFKYTWEWFQPLVEFYQRSAAAGHLVLFTADQ